jgi:hypothetical protein
MVDFHEPTFCILDANESRNSGLQTKGVELSPTPDRRNVGTTADPSARGHWEVQRCAPLLLFRPLNI